MIELILVLIALVMGFGACYLMWWHVFKETDNIFNTYTPERIKTIAEEINEDPLSIEIRQCVGMYEAAEIHRENMQRRLLKIIGNHDFLNDIPVDAHHYDSYKI